MTNPYILQTAFMSIKTKYQRKHTSFVPDVITKNQKYVYNGCRYILWHYITATLQNCNFVIN